MKISQFAKSPPTVLERILLWYGRRFPFAKGKLRVINIFWPLAAGGSYKRIATLRYSGFQMPCDLRFMLQRQFYFFGTYFSERKLLECWAGFARKAQVIFDVGANAGIYSIAALSTSPRVDVHAFEPTPEIADRLRATVEINNLTRLVVNETAVSDSNGETNLVHCQGGTDNDGMNFIQSSSNPAGCDRVKLVTLDAYCAATNITRIDLMKIDIQGAEAEALRGATGLLKERRIGVIFIELNWGPDPKICVATEVVAILDAHGFLFAAPRAQLNWRPAGTWLRSLTDVVAASRVEL